MKTQETRLVGKKETFAYAFGDFGFQLAWGTMGAYLMYFLTDMFGLAASSLIALGIITRLWDGTNDVIMGVIADRSKIGKYGKYLKYIRYGAIPLGIAAVLMFTAPAFPQYWMKVAWAYFTYILADGAFTVVNLPYNALLPSMTNNFQERTKLTTVRIAIMMVGAIIVNTATRPLFMALGGGKTDPASMARGMTFTMIIYMLIAVPLLLICSKVCKERIVVKEAQEKIPFKKAAKALSGQWFILLIMNFTFWLSQTIRTGMLIYYAQYIIGNAATVSILAPIGLMSSLPMILLTPKLAKWMNSKRWPVIIGLIISIVGAGMTLMAGNNIGMLAAAIFLTGLGTGPQAALNYSMMADVVDYGEWKSGVRAQGLLYSSSSFGVKMGTALGAVVISVMLTIANYTPGVAQSDFTKNIMMFTMLGIPAICMIAVIVALLFYKLDGKRFQQIREELIARRGTGMEEEKDNIDETKFSHLIES